jgi:saccharopine dehydrogenase-like NADP-dependent oxidoreductase
MEWTGQTGRCRTAKSPRILPPMTRALILGGGMVGSAMAMDLAADSDFEVTVADRRPEALRPLAENHGVTAQTADLSQAAEIQRLADGADVILGALSSHMGLEALRAVIETGRPYVDISFMAEDPRELHEAAKAKGTVVIVDCGVAPGTSNMIAGHAARELDRFDELEILVGGVPLKRHWPFEFKVGFAPIDVIEEYTRPARVVEHGKIVTYPALSGVELVDIEGLGTLEAFNTDGLRSLAYTLDVPNMREKTMRYPGHAELMRVFRESGFFSEAPIDVDGQKVSPLSLTSKLLFPKWLYEDGEVDLTVLRITARGQKDGRDVAWRWEMLDRQDPNTGLRSMSRTTGFPATVTARLLAQGKFDEPGVHPPEVLGMRGLWPEIRDALDERGIDYRLSKA